MHCSKTEQRLDGLTDEPRPGRPRTLTDEQVEAVVVKTLETKPKDATHWSTRSMAEQTGLTQNAIWRIWQAFGLQPHRQERWKLSKDPLFVDKVKDICGLYLNPPERAVCPVHRRKIADPGVGSHRADSAAAARHPGSARPTTMSVTAPRACTPLWISRTGR